MSSGSRMYWRGFRSSRGCLIHFCPTAGRTNRRQSLRERHIRPCRRVSPILLVRIAHAYMRISCGDSMRPRPFGPGYTPFRALAEGEFGASMRPRPFGLGRNYPTSRVCVHRQSSFNEAQAFWPRILDRNLRNRRGYAELQ